MLTNNYKILSRDRNLRQLRYALFNKNITILGKYFPVTVVRIYN